IERRIVTSDPVEKLLGQGDDGKLFRLDDRRKFGNRRAVEFEPAHFRLRLAAWVREDLKIPMMGRVCAKLTCLRRSSTCSCTTASAAMRRTSSSLRFQPKCALKRRICSSIKSSSVVMAQLYCRQNVKSRTKCPVPNGKLTWRWEGS